MAAGLLVAEVATAETYPGVANVPVKLISKPAIAVPVVDIDLAPEGSTMG
jgi:hypothetical protein